MAAHLLSLQRTIGNAAVARYVPNLEDSSVGPAPAPDVIRDSRDPRLRPAVPHLPRGAEVPGIVVCYAAGVDDLLDVEHHWIEMGDESYGWWPSEDVGASRGRRDRRAGRHQRHDAAAHPRHRHARSPPRRSGAALRGAGDDRRLPDRPGRGDGHRRRAHPRLRARFSGNYTWNPAGSDCHEFVEEALLAAGLEPRR